MSVSKIIVAPDDVKYAAFKKNTSRCESFNDRERIAKELKSCAIEIPKDSGFVNVKSGKFEETKDIVKDAVKLSKVSKINDWSNIGKKNTRVDLLQQEDLDLNSPYLKFALNKNVVATVSNYLGHVPILNFIFVMYSRYYNDKIVGAQLYHCDYQDIHNMMIFMPATDVLSSQDGPVTVIPRNKSVAIRKRMLSKFNSKIQLSSDYEHKIVSADDRNEMLGSAGSAAFIDSANCFHFGSRVAKNKNSRVMVMFHYLSPAAINVNMKDLKNRPFARLDSADLEEYKRYVLGHKV